MKTSTSIAANPLATPPQENDISPDIYDELITWSVKLNSGTALEDDFASFKAWRDTSPLHEKAWQKLQSIEQNLKELPGAKKALAIETLELAAKQRISKPGRRKAIRLLSLGTMAFTVAAFFLNNHGPWHAEATYATAVGKKSQVQLADGTSLLLNTNTRVDVNFTLLKRELVLHEGEIYIDTGKDVDSLIGRRSFWVQTSNAGLEAIGTRFAVEQDSLRTRLHVTEGVVAIHAGASRTQVHANETYVISSTSSQAVRVGNPSLDPMGWVDNVLMAKQMRLDEFVAELSRYQSIVVSCDREASNLTVSGVFQLDRPDPIEHALEAVTRTLPVQVVHQSSTKITISRKGHP